MRGCFVEAAAKKKGDNLNERRLKKIEQVGEIWVGTEIWSEEEAKRPGARCGS